MGEGGTGDSDTSVDASHVVEYDVDNDLDALLMASGDHRSKGISVASLGLNLVADSLVVGPPLIALYVLHSRAHCARS